jgi:hypothetical protein
MVDVYVRPPAQRDRQQTAGEPGEIGQRHTAHAARVALEDARLGGPRMGSRSGWYQPGGKPRIPESLLVLSPYCPELNPVEKASQFLRQNHVRNRSARNL